MKTEKVAKETLCLQACKQTKPQINNKQNQQTSNRHKTKKQ
jgi:hypothetical protein